MNSLRVEGQKTVAIEIVQQFDWEVPDWVLVIPAAISATSTPSRKGLDMLFSLGLITKRPRICVGQAEAANPLYLAYQRDFEVFEPIAARKTVASAIQIGNPVSYEKAVDALRRYDGVVEQASESEIMEECAKADRTGLFNCPHTGVALVALRKLQARGLVKKGDQVVVISTAHGLKFVDSKLAYHSMQLEGIVSEHPNPPIELDANYGQVRDRMKREIDRRFGG
jgi:threonine synthase